MMLDRIDTQQLEKIDQEWRENLQAACEELEPTKQYLLDLYSEKQRPQSYDPQEILSLQEALVDGTKPSDYVGRNLSWLFGHLIPAEHKAVALDAMDRLLELPYDTDSFRRSLRCRSTKAYVSRIRDMLRSFCTDTTLAYSLSTLLGGSIPLQDWGYGHCHRHGMTLPFRIAMALDAHSLSFNSTS